MIRRFLFLALVAATVACERGNVPGRESGAAFRGVVLDPPLEKPDFTFTDADGQPFNFRLKTAGKVALLFFGYTHCPDVCPLHAANVAAVLKQMPFEERGKVVFVFVTTDPERDTPQRLKEWLGAFDPTFVGLTGPPAELTALQAAMRLPPARKEVPAGMDSTNYLVGHGAQVIAFGLDDMARVEYPFGVRQEDWANDLPRLVRGEVPRLTVQRGPADIDLAPSTTGLPPAPPIQVEVAVMPAPATTSEAAVYLVIRNNGGDDTLTTVFSPDAEGAMIHRTVREGQAMQMTPAGAVPIPAGTTLRFVPGETHVMLMNLTRRPVEGESFPLQLRFAKAGDFVIAPMVVKYAEVEAALRPQR